MNCHGGALGGTTGAAEATNATGAATASNGTETDADTDVPANLMAIHTDYLKILLDLNHNLRKVYEKPGYSPNHGWKIRSPSDRIIRIFAHQHCVEILSEFRKTSQNVSEIQFEF